MLAQTGPIQCAHRFQCFGDSERSVPRDREASLAGVALFGRPGWSEKVAQSSVGWSWKARPAARARRVPWLPEFFSHRPREIILIMLITLIALAILAILATFLAPMVPFGTLSQAPMEARLSFKYDREADILYIDRVCPYPEQETEELGDSVIARLNPTTSQIETLEEC